MKKRAIKFIVVHCTATSQKATIEAIKNYWFTRLKWSKSGYHWIIPPDGGAVLLHPEELPSNGVQGHNHHSVNVAYIGGVDGDGNALDNRTPAQKKELVSILKELKQRYPDAKIVGHRDFEGVKKACPCFDAITEYKNITAW